MLLGSRSRCGFAFVSIRLSLVFCSSFVSFLLGLLSRFLLHMATIIADTHTCFCNSRTLSTQHAISCSLPASERPKTRRGLPHPLRLPIYPLNARLPVPSLLPFCCLLSQSSGFPLALKLVYGRSHASLVFSLSLFRVSDVSP